MRIVKIGQRWQIVRGLGMKTAFDYFVDDDSACWSRLHRHLFHSRAEAEEALTEIRRRQQVKRQAREEKLAQERE